MEGCDVWMGSYRGFSHLNLNGFSLSTSHFVVAEMTHAHFGKPGLLSATQIGTNCNLRYT